MDAIESRSNYSHYSKYIPNTPELATRSGRCILAVAALILLAAGTCDSLLAKLMDRQKVKRCAECEPLYFHGPVFQTLISYFIEAGMLVPVMIDRYCSRRRNVPQALRFQTTKKSFHKRPCPPWRWAAPGVLDMISSTMVNYAFILARVSTVQLLRNFNVVITAGLTLLYLRYALKLYQIVGVIVVTVGLVITGIQAIIYPETSTNYPEFVWLGITFAIVGTAINALQFIMEESVFRHHYASPCEAIGFFGVFGILTSLAVIALFEVIPQNGEMLEKISRTLYSLGTGEPGSKIAVTCAVVLMFSIALFNLSGMTITKMGSGLLRAIVISLRTLTIWIVEIILGWNNFSILNVVGLTVTLFGVLIYNYEFLITPGWFPGDALWRKSIMCCSFLRDPDEDMFEPPEKYKSAALDEAEEPGIQMEERHEPKI